MLWVDSDRWTATIGPVDSLTFSNIVCNFYRLSLRKSRFENPTVEVSQRKPSFWRSKSPTQRRNAIKPLESAISDYKLHINNGYLICVITAKDNWRTAKDNERQRKTKSELS